MLRDINKQFSTNTNRLAKIYRINKTQILFNNNKYQLRIKNKLWISKTYKIIKLMVIFKHLTNNNLKILSNNNNKYTLNN